MPTIAIIYHTGFGHTKIVAEHVHRGAGSVDGVDAALIPVAVLPPAGEGGLLGGRWGEVDAADAMIFGCPTYMGSVSAGFKVFMETSSHYWLTQAWRDKLAAGFTVGGGLSGDKLNALTDMAVFAAQHSMLWVSQGVESDKAGLNRMGSYLGMMAQADNGPAEETIGPEDRATAERFGARIAVATMRWAHGAA